MNYIALAWLREKRACADSLDFFKKRFGSGAQTREAVDFLLGWKPKWRELWIGWLLGQDLLLTMTIIGYGLDIEDSKNYALSFAALGGRLDIIKCLAENGANLRTENDFPFTCSAEQGHLEVVKFFVESGADIHALRDYAFKITERRGHVLVADFLRQAAQKKY